MSSYTLRFYAKVASLAARYNMCFIGCLPTIGQMPHQKNSQVPHQKPAKCHIKNRPNATFNILNLLGFKKILFAMAQTNIKRLLQGETPRLIDEWQMAPQFWDAVRNEVDRRDEDGQFMLTGSAVPPKGDEIFHSGTGRMSWLKLRPRSLWESGDSSGDVSLGSSPNIWQNFWPSK